MPSSRIICSFCLTAEQNNRRSDQQHYSNDQEAFAERDDERRLLHQTLQRFVSLLHRGNGITGSPEIFSSLCVKEVLYVGDVAGDALADPDVVELLTLRD